MASNSTAVALRTPLDAALCVQLVSSVAKFLLFMRGQVPCVLDELERLVVAYGQQQEAQDHTTRRRATISAMRKAIKCVDALDHVLHEGLPSLFAGPVQTVAIVFGASLLNPREVVVVDFGAVERADPMDVEATISDSVCDSTPPVVSSGLSKDKLGRLCVQKLLRALIMDGAFQWTRNLPVTRMHIAVLAARQQTRLTPGFQPKQSFSLRLPRSRRGQEERTHWIKLSTGDNPSSSDGVIPTEQCTLHADDSFIWYVLEKPIQGFAGAL